LEIEPANKIAAVDQSDQFYLLGLAPEPQGQCVDHLVAELAMKGAYL
jgi:hypothetical protein